MAMTCPANLSIVNTTVCNSCESNIGAFAMRFAEDKWYIHTHVMLGFINMLYFRSATITIIIAFVNESGETLMSLINCAWNGISTKWRFEETSADSLIMDPGAAAIGLGITILLLKVQTELLSATGTREYDALTKFRLIYKKTRIKGEVPMGLHGKDGYMYMGEKTRLFIRLLWWLVSYAGVMSVPVVITFWVGTDMPDWVQWSLFYSFYTIVPIPFQFLGICLANQDSDIVKKLVYGEARGPSEMPDRVPIKIMFSSQPLWRGFLKMWSLVIVTLTIFWIVCVPPIMHSAAFNHVLISMSLCIGISVLFLLFYWLYRIKTLPKQYRYTPVKTAEPTQQSRTTSQLRLRF